MIVFQIFSDKSKLDKLEMDQAMANQMQQLSMLFEVVTEYKKNSETFKNGKIEELLRISAEQCDEIQRLNGLLIERKVEATFLEQSEKPRAESNANLAEAEMQGKWKRRLSSDTEEEASDFNEEEKERVLSPIRKIQLGRKRPKTMSKDSDQILKQREKEIMSLKSSFKRSQKDAEEVISENKRRINKLEQENLKLRQTVDETLSQSKFTDILRILDDFKIELGTRQHLPEAANKENIEMNTESMKENSDSSNVDMDEDETEACQMAVRDLQHSADHRDKLEAENVRLVTQLREKEAELSNQEEKLRELQDKVDNCSECVHKQNKLDELKSNLEHQEKIILCKSQEIKAKNEEIQQITILANLTKSEVSNLTETVKKRDTETAAQKDDNDSLRKIVGQLEEKCNELKLIENSLKEKINQGDEKNQRLCKYLEKLKKYVDQRNNDCEMYLKETKRVKELVKQKFDARIFSKHGEIRIE